jgi:hypothetical protein
MIGKPKAPLNYHHESDGKINIFKLKNGSPERVNHRIEGQWRVGRCLVALSHSITSSATVARMERSDIRERSRQRFPDFAALNPGYSLKEFQRLAAAQSGGFLDCSQLLVCVV